MATEGVADIEIRASLGGIPRVGRLCTTEACSASSGSRSRSLREPPRLRWTGGRTLEVSVPNLTEYFYRLTEHDGVQVRLVYRDDNPKVRGEWVRHRLEREFRR